MVNLMDLQNHLQSCLSDYLRSWGEPEHLSCLSVAVDIPGYPMVVTQSGTTQYQGGNPVGPDNLYQIGSNTKAFTAVAVLQLEERGVISIDQPIAQYLPQYTAFSGLTLRQCLSMTGHIESYDNLHEWAKSYAADPRANVPADTLIKLASRSDRIKKNWYYSNTGYLLAQQIVEKYTEDGYAGAIARITRTAGLGDTFYSSHLYDPAIANRIVAGYYLNDDKGLEGLWQHDVSRYSLSWAQGAGAMVSIPADLAKWARILYQGPSVLAPKQRGEMLRLVSMKTGFPMLIQPNMVEPLGFGLGVGKSYGADFLENDRLHWFYEGKTLGFRALHIYSPYMDFVLCLFANSRPIDDDDHNHLKGLSMKLYTEVLAAVT